LAIKEYTSSGLIDGPEYLEKIFLKRYLEVWDITPATYFEFLP
jgi:hypothetical protein